MKKLTKEVINSRLAPRGIKLLSPYTNTNNRGIFRCANGHEWEAVVNQVLHGYGCKVCSGLVPYTKESINEKIKSRGLELIGEFTRAGSKAEFRCPHDHTWKAVPHHVISGSGCPVCARQPKFTKENINERLAPREIKVVGDFEKTTDKTELECKYGHRWTAKLSSVLHRDGCPHCSGNVPLTKEIVNQRIEHRGIELIGEFINSSTKTTFRCSKGHEWEAKPQRTVHDRGCPHCAGTIPLTKDIINERIKDRGIVALTEHKPNEKTRFRCSEEHEWETLAYTVLSGFGCPICSGSAPLTKEIVNERIVDRGIELIGEYITTQTKTTFRCKEGHEWNAEPSNVMHGETGCPECMERGSDNDTIYIWREIRGRYNGKPVYKIGITSARLGDARIKSVAKKHEVDFEIVVIAETKIRATDIEEELKKIGENPGYIGDGATEFRAMSDDELQKALDLIERVQTSMHTQLSLFSEK